MAVSRGDLVRLTQFRDGQEAEKAAKLGKNAGWNYAHEGYAAKRTKLEVLSVYASGMVRVSRPGGGTLRVDPGWIVKIGSVGGYKTGDTITTGGEELYTSGFVLDLHNKTLTLGEPYGKSKPNCWRLAQDSRNPESLWHCWLDEHWIVSSDSAPAAIKDCSCSLSAGCTCGAFAAEMSVAGKVYDPYLHYYVKEKK